ncbi:MAG: 3-oxoacyl-[acyl-carrier-protein] synthase III C-terminal domain-containing protein, partial [Pseudobdellovibrio sp.]
IVPTLSLLLSEKLKLKQNCQRSDLVGMGCSAGLNGLEVVANWCEKNAGKNAVLVCCEISSAAYVNEAGEANALVNSLFGDGVAACVVRAEAGETNTPALKKFASYRIENSLDFLKYNWNRKQNLNQFFVSKETPAKMGRSIGAALKEILEKNESLDQVDHWVFHTGGAAILKHIAEALRLDEKKIQNTTEVLKNYGNLSSGSFLFSYQRLIHQKTVKKGDRGLMITMGPGLAIEMAKLQW